MYIKEENICRLCLKVAVNVFGIIDENIRNIFEVLMLKVNLDISDDPIICKDCAEIVEKCFKFKSACTDTEKHVISFAIDKNRATLESQDVYKVENDVESVDNNLICRFCSSHSSGSNLVLLETLSNDDTFADMLQVLMPDMDFHMKSSIICATCKQNLESYVKFFKNCLDIEEKITKYSQYGDTSSCVRVKLTEILHFLFKDNLELEHTQLHSIKQEDTWPGQSIYNSDLIKAEEPLDIKNEEIIFTACESQKRNADQMSRTKNISKAEILKCEICTYEAKQKCNLKRHVLIHKDIIEVEMFKCAMCVFKTKYERSLKTHMLLHKDNTEVEMYECPMCTFETKHKGSLTRHMLIHKDITEVQMHKCSMCTYETKGKGNLKQHMLIHKDVTEVKMYKCSMCTYEAKRKDYLKSHVITHKAKNMGVEMYKCSMCTYETKCKKLLRRHVLIHKDITEVKMFKCSMCTHETRDNRNLKRHMLIHKDNTEVQMYKCLMCTYEAKRKDYLKSHLRIHKVIKKVEMHKCSMCTYETKH